MKLSLIEKVSQLSFFNKYYKKNNDSLRKLVDHWSDKYFALLAEHQTALKEIDTLLDKVSEKYQELDIHIENSVDETLELEDKISKLEKEKEDLYRDLKDENTSLKIEAFKMRNEKILNSIDPEEAELLEAMQGKG